ncbi:hypothetical protein [Segetibacter koreensis]|uniref:hypothetical protein n=1 Tax=Segetibacter koreensis TaxID=398037 RepID=UPI00036A2940|nr:hypothetical protein [Segetibacter koreensis]
MENEKLDLVLSELWEDLKGVRQMIGEQKEQMQQLQQEVTNLRQKLEQKKLIVPPIDTKPVQLIVTAAIAKVRQLVSEQPKPVIQERRFLLFPEYNAREYYKRIFRLIMWFTLVSMGTYLFVLGKQALENYKEVQLRQLEANQYKNTWQYMYHQEGKQGKKKMDNAWQKAFSESSN